MQSIKRDTYLKRLIDRRQNGMIKIITGIRRCGKSYLLFRLYREYLLAEGVSESDIICLDLDDEANAEYRQPDKLYNYILSKIGSDERQYYVFLDEVQFAISKEEVGYTYGVSRKRRCGGSASAHFFGIFPGIWWRQV